MTKEQTKEQIKEQEKERLKNAIDRAVSEHDFKKARELTIELLEM